MALLYKLISAREGKIIVYLQKGLKKIRQILLIYKPYWSQSWDFFTIAHVLLEVESVQYIWLTNYSYLRKRKSSTCLGFGTLTIKDCHKPLGFLRICQSSHLGQKTVRANRFPVRINWKRLQWKELCKLNPAGTC